MKFGSSLVLSGRVGAIKAIATTPNSAEKKLRNQYHTYG
jgi:hypothetical protein